MTIKVLFECSGCFKKADGTTWLSRRFESANGKGYGFGVYKYDSPQDVAPDGWIAFDPYTGCCYCPECWAEVNKGENDE